MLGFWDLMVQFLLAAFGADAAALRREMRDRYNRVRNAIMIISWGLPISIGLAAAAHYWLDNPYAKVLHGLYGIVVITYLMRIYQDGMIGYSLIAVNKKFVELLAGRLAAILKKGGHGAEAIAQAIQEAKDKFKQNIAQPTGEWGDMALTALTECLTPLKLGADGTKAVTDALASDLEDFRDAVKDFRPNLKKLLREEALPPGQLVASLVLGVMIFSLINAFWPWWVSPLAYLLGAITLVAGLFLWITSIPRTDSTTKAEATQTPTWVKRLAFVGIVGLIGLILGYLSLVNDLADEKSQTFLMLLAGAPLALVGLYYAYCAGWQKTFVVILAAISTSAIVAANYHESVPRYLGTWHAGGIAKHDIVEAEDAAIAVESTLFSRNGNHLFTPRRNAAGDIEMVDTGRTLLCLDAKAVKDVTGEKWLRVVEVDNEGHAKNEKPYYIPWRLDYVRQVPGPGVPVEMIRSSAAAEMAKPARVDFSAALAFHAFAKEKFAPAWQRVTWHGFPPATEKFSDPLASFKIKRRFSDPMPKGDYSGVDMVCDFSADEIPVYAAANGVVDATTLTHRSVTIKHQDGVWLYYGNLNTIAAGIKAGVKVKRGQEIGSIANDSPDGAYHGQPTLFLTAIREDESDNTIVPVDPLPLLGRAPYPTLASDEDNADEEE